MEEEKTLPINHYYIYALQHNATGKIYVGITTDLKVRILAHLSALRSGRHSNEALQTDCEQNGVDITTYLLEEFDYPKYPFADLRRGGHLEREKNWMLKLRTYDERIGYNTNDLNFKRRKCSLNIIHAVPTPNEVDDEGEDCNAVE